MNLVDILNADAVRMIHGVSSKKKLFQEIAQIAAATSGIDAGTATAALLERENLGATGVGHGVALPHARLDSLDQIVGCFARLDKPIEFDAVDRQPVDLIFTLFAPHDHGVGHLKALAAVSRTLRDAGVCNKLRGNENSSTLHAILLEGPASKAA